MISNQSDIKVISVKDYFVNPKPSGYKSYHMLVTVPVYLSDRIVDTKVEIQIRTVAMDFWAQLDYQLCYKKNIEEKTLCQIQEKLSKYAEEIAGIDRQMMRLRRQIENS